jgi:hypothetical protein
MSKKRCFFLKGFSHEEIDKKYGLSIISNIEKEANVNENKTDITDILDKSEEVCVSFVDEKNDKCLITMLDWINKDKFPLKTDKLCFWCKHSFQTKPIGCPIKFINNRIEKSYISHITKDKYFMKENLTKNKLLHVLGIKQEYIEIKPIETEYYLTDGIFCSFNCIIAFIDENSHDFLYNESKMLTFNMYKDTLNKETKKIKPAPHWRLLKSFGGSLSIEEFRNCFNLYEYEECSFHMKTLSKIFKEK